MKQVLSQEAGSVKLLGLKRYDGAEPFRGTTPAVADGGYPVTAVDPHPSGRQEQTIRIPHLRVVPSPPPLPRRDLKPLAAVVLVPPGIQGSGLWTDACAEHVQKRGYRLAAVCSAWADAMRMIFDGIADVIVVGRRDHLPRDRTPRVDVITEANQAGESRRRPQRRK